MTEVAPAGVTLARPVLGLDFAPGAAIDVTLRIVSPQFEAGAAATSPMLPPPGAPGPSSRAADILIVRTLAERRAAIVARLVGMQGQSRAFFIGVAAAMGVAITIDEFPVSVADDALADEPLYEQEWAWVWRVNAPFIPAIEAAADDSSADDPLAQAANPPLECVIERLKPGHTRVLFNYAA